MSSRQKIAMSNGAFVCKWASCGVKFKTKNSLRSHIGKHPPQHVFICMWESCERQFSNMAKYLTHYKVHARQTPFTCNECDQSFSRRTYLKEHLKEHQLINRILDEQTETKKVKLNYKGNIGNANEEIKPKPTFQCNVNGCTKNYAFRQSLHWHTSVHHKKKATAVAAKTAETGDDEIDRDQSVTAIDCLSQGTTTIHTNHKRKSSDAGVSLPGKRRRANNGGLGYACPVEGCESLVKLRSSLGRHMRVVHNQKLDASQFNNNTSESRLANINDTPPSSPDDDVESLAGRVIRNHGRPFGFPCPEPGCKRRYMYARSLRRHTWKRHTSHEEIAALRANMNVPASTSEQCSQLTENDQLQNSQINVDSPSSASKVNLNGSANKSEQLSENDCIPSSEIKADIRDYMSMTAEELEAETLSAVASLGAIFQLDEQEPVEYGSDDVMYNGQVNIELLTDDQTESEDEVGSEGTWTNSCESDTSDAKMTVERESGVDESEVSGGDEVDMNGSVNESDDDAENSDREVSRDQTDWETGMSVGDTSMSEDDPGSTEEESGEEEEDC